MSDHRPPGTEEKILALLQGWQEPALSQYATAILNGDKYDECPLKAAGFILVPFSELGELIIGADGKCICTTGSHCLDTDKRDGLRCTHQHLQELNSQAMHRRSMQSGNYH